MINRESLPFSPEERAAISDYLKRIDPIRNAWVIGQTIMNISKEFGRLNLPELDQLLREQNSLTFFVALPSSELPEYVSVLPHSGDLEYPNYLYICVYGEEEYHLKLEEYELTPELNLQYLTETGMLAPLQGTQTARMIHSQLN